MAKSGPENPREAAGALGDTDSGALLVSGRKIGEQAEEGRAGQAGADGQQGQGSQHPSQGKPWVRSRTPQESRAVPLMKGSQARLTAVRTRLNAMSRGSPSTLTRRPMAPPWTKAPISPQ